MILFKEKRKISVLKNENCHTSNTVHYILQYPIWQYGLWSFQAGDTKLERFLHKNQHAQKKLLIFDNWTNGSLQKSEFVKLSISFFPEYKGWSPS